MGRRPSLARLERAPGTGRSRPRRASYPGAPGAGGGDPQLACGEHVIPLRAWVGSAHEEDDGRSAGPSDAATARAV